MLYFHISSWAFVVYFFSLFIKINHLSGLHFPTLPAASPALIATGHFPFGYVFLLPSPLPNLVLSNRLKNVCIDARTITDVEEHKAAIKYSGKWRLREAAEEPAILSAGLGPGRDHSLTGQRRAVSLLLRHKQLHGSLKSPGSQFYHTGQEKTGRGDW